MTVTAERDGWVRMSGTRAPEPAASPPRRGHRLRALSYDCRHDGNHTGFGSDAVPHCGAKFRVRPEQVKPHAGLVRCGACRGILTLSNT